MTLIMYMAVSIDGIAALDGKNGIERYGSREDHDFFLAGAKSCDAVIMGKNTAASFKVYGLPNFILTHDPDLLQAKKLPQAKILQQDQNPAGAAAAKAQDQDQDARGSGRTCERVYLSGQPQEVCKELEARGIKKAALLGGPFTNAQFLRAGLVDEIFLTVEPVTLGRGIRFLNEPLESFWTLAGAKVLNERGAIVLHYVASAGRGETARKNA